MLFMIIFGAVLLTVLVAVVIYCLHKKVDRIQSDSKDIAFNEKKVRKNRKLYYVVSLFAGIATLVFLSLILVFHFLREPQVVLCFVVPMMISIIATIAYYGKGKSCKIQLMHFSKKNSNTK